MSWKFGKKAATSALIKAVKEDSLQDAEEALRRGADANGKNSLDLLERSPLSIAVEKNNIAMVQLLLNNNANINDKDAVGNTALVEAVGRKDPDIPTVQCLIDNGADVNAKGLGGYTALIWAAFHDQPEIAQQLMDKKADLDAAGGDGCTALIVAVTMRKDSLAQMLVERGAALDIESGSGKTALDHARTIQASNQGSHIAQMLEDTARKRERTLQAEAQAAVDRAKQEKISAAHNRTARRRQNMKCHAGKKPVIRPGP
jgi:ankyrin repeat protein